MNKKCFFKGHDTDPKFNDNGYLVCKRCGSHEYYDADGDFYKTIKDRSVWIKKVWEKFKAWAFFRCGECDKVRHIAGINTGYHKDCLPF